MVFLTNISNFRAEMLEKQMQLRTKAMREKDEQREIRKYKFALIRIRFPDGLYLQVQNKNDRFFRT